MERPKKKRELCRVPGQRVRDGGIKGVRGSEKVVRRKRANTAVRGVGAPGPRGWAVCCGQGRSPGRTQPEESGVLEDRGWVRSC